LPPRKEKIMFLIFEFLSGPKVDKYKS
jgi:hypothetical protein